MYAVCTQSNHPYEAILMSTHNIHLKYRTPKRYPTIISIVPLGVALVVTFWGLNYRRLEQIFMVPKGFEPLKFDCNLGGPVSRRFRVSWVTGASNWY